MKNLEIPQSAGIKNSTKTRYSGHQCARLSRDLTQHDQTEGFSYYVGVGSTNKANIDAHLFYITIVVADDKL